MVSTTIQVKRGLAAGIPALADGELGWTTDTHKLYGGQGGANYLIGNAGTVTSVAMSVPSLLSVAGSPITGSGTFAVTWSGVSQGDVLYGSGANTVAVLAKNTTASRYLSNSGSSNNPAWSQVDLTNGVTGALPSANIGAHATTHKSGGSDEIKLNELGAASGDVALNSKKITGLADPVSDQDAVTKTYADQLRNGLQAKQAVRAATTGALPTNTRTGNILTAALNGALPSQDGVSLNAGDRLLVKNEVTSANNGWYTVTSLGSVGAVWVLTRSTDADTSAEVTSGAYSWVDEGTTQSDERWVLSTYDPITLNTTGLTFIYDGGLASVTAGTGLTKTGNTLNAGAGIGIQVNADTIDVLYGTTSTTACVGNDSRLSDSRAPNGAAGGDLTGTYPNPTLAAAVVTAVKTDYSVQLASRIFG